MSESNHVHHGSQSLVLRLFRAVHNNLFRVIVGLALLGFILWAAHQDFTALTSNIRFWVTGGVILAIFLHLIGFGLIARFLGKGFKEHSVHTHHNKIEELETRGDKIRWSSAYDWMAQIISLGREKEFRNKIIDLAELKPGDEVLDVGCGTGTLLMTAEQRLNSVGRFVGIDAAHEMTTKAREKAKKAGLKAVFRPGLIEKIEFAENEFDVAMNSLVMHHLPDEEKEKGVCEMHRVLKPNGRILIVDIEASAGSRMQRLTDFLVNLHGGPERAKNSMQALRPLLEEIGFEEIEIGKVNRQMGYIKGEKPE